MMNKIFFKAFAVIAVALLAGCGGDDNTPEEEEFVFPSKVINRIAVDAGGIKWFATEKGLVRFDGTTWKSYSDD